MSVAHIYEGWPKVQTRLIHSLPKLSPSQLQMTSSTGSWPIWAIVSHIAGARVYWLCYIFKEPGADTAPYAAVDGGWEDHIDQPRTVDEVMFALEGSWRIVESCLARWTPEMLDEVFTRQRGDVMQRHSRHSVLTRMVMHDSFHCGEISLMLGTDGPSMDPWEPIT